MKEFRPEDEEIEERIGFNISGAESPESLPTVCLWGSINFYS